VSLASEPRAAEPTAPELSAGIRCERCGARLADDQEWCFRCGAARTLIHPPPDWRVPVAVIAAVVVLVLVAVAIALIELAGAG
jgi:uncharacterized OB-fold protein